MAVRRRRKYQRKQLYQEDESKKDDQKKELNESHLHSLASNNLDETSVPMRRNNTPVPIVSTFDDDFDRQEDVKPIENAQFYLKDQKAKSKMREEEKVTNKLKL